MEKYDLAIIGGGPGGYPAAIRAAQSGLKTVLIEQRELGGTCLNRGCIPTKTLLASAALFQEIQKAKSLGVDVADVTANYTAMWERKQEVVQKLQGGIGQLLKAHNVTVYKGTAQFESRRILRINQTDTTQKRLESDFIIIATGTEPARPSFVPDLPSIIDSTTFLELQKLPDSLLVMGGGIIGCEIACLAAMLGVQVTVVEMLDDILTILDRDTGTVVRRYMEKELKVRIFTGTKVEQITPAATGGVSVATAGESLAADMLLAAIGRTPQTKLLNLAAAGLQANQAGYLEVDKNYRTRAANIFAIGDVNGGMQLAHAATAQGLAVIDVISTGQPATRALVVPSCVFTMPEVGHVGLTEQEAREQERDIVVGKFNFAALGKALASGAPTGFVKWIADPETEQLLGAQAVGMNATELIAEAGLAVQMELTLTDIARAIHSHPTLSEAWMEAANAALGLCVHAPPPRRRKE